MKQYICNKVGQMDHCPFCTHGEPHLVSHIHSEKCSQWGDCFGTYVLGKKVGRSGYFKVRCVLIKTTAI